MWLDWETKRVRNNFECHSLCLIDVGRLILAPLPTKILSNSGTSASIVSILKNTHRIKKTSVVLRHLEFDLRP